MLGYSYRTLDRHAQEAASPTAATPSAADIVPALPARPVGTRETPERAHRPDHLLASEAPQRDTLAKTSAPQS
jgi:hypothetical protein